MIGVILWSSPAKEKAVIWCEDHGSLAYLQGRDNLAFACDWPDAGDLVTSADTAAEARTPSPSTRSANAAPAAGSAIMSPSGNPSFGFAAAGISELCNKTATTISSPSVCSESSSSPISSCSFWDISGETESSAPPSSTSLENASPASDGRADMVFAALTGTAFAKATINGVMNFTPNSFAGLPSPGYQIFTVRSYFSTG